MKFYFDLVPKSELEELANKNLLPSKLSYLDFSICNDMYYIAYDSNDNKVGGFALREKKNKIVELNLLFNFYHTGKEMIEHIITRLRSRGYSKVVLNCYGDFLRDYYHDNFGFMVYMTMKNYKPHNKEIYYEMEKVL